MVIELGEPERFYLVEVPVAGALVLRRAGEEAVCTPDAPGVLSATEQVNKHWSPDCAVLLVRLDRTAVETRLAQLLDRPLTAPLRFALAGDAHGAGMRSWLRHLWWLLGELDQPGALLQHPAWVTAAEDTLLTGLLYAQPHTYSEALRAESPAPWR